MLPGDDVTLACAAPSDDKTERASFSPFLGLVSSRLLATIPVVLAVVIISFLLLHLVPGDPVTALVGDYPAPPEYVEQMRHTFGLDQPLAVQLWVYSLNLFTR